MADLERILQDVQKARGKGELRIINWLLSPIYRAINANENTLKIVKSQHFFSRFHFVTLQAVNMNQRKLLK